MCNFILISLFFFTFLDQGKVCPNQILTIVNSKYNNLLTDISFTYSYMIKYHNISGHGKACPNGETS